MMKPRIILADTDTGYMEQLHIRLAEAFPDNADFEIITDPVWFEEYLSVCREAALLVISEKLYGGSLDRHAFRKTIILSENTDQTERISPDVYRMNRFQGISELYAEIYALSGLAAAGSKKAGPKIIAVSSAAGGDGKTYVSLNLAAALAQNGKKVLYLNACRLQAFGRYLENSTPVTESRVYVQLAGETADAYESVKREIRKEQFYYLPPFRGLLSSSGIRYSVYQRIAEAAVRSGEYEYVILDTDSAADEMLASLFELADRVVLVVKESAGSVYALEQLADSLTKAETEKYLLVCNDAAAGERSEASGPPAVCGYPVRAQIEHVTEFDTCKLRDLPLGSGIRRIAIQLS